MEEEKSKENIQNPHLRRFRWFRDNAYWIILPFYIVVLVFLAFPEMNPMFKAGLNAVIVILILYSFVRHTNFEWYSYIIILFLFLIIGGVAVPQLLHTSGHAPENRCKAYLRAIGSSQLAFKDGNNGKYGTWQELTDADYIQEGYTRGNMIDNYSMPVFRVNHRTLGEGNEDMLISSFTIVAVPRRGIMKLRGRIGWVVYFGSPPGGWRIFGIGEDQIPRVWVGSREDWTTENVSLNNRDLWEPLR